MDMAELVGVARHIDRDDAAVAVLDRHGHDRPIRLAQHEAGEAVDGGGAHLNVRQRRILARDAGEEAQDLVGP
jgi:hypothetical protein